MTFPRMLVIAVAALAAPAFGQTAMVADIRSLTADIRDLQPTILGMGGEVSDLSGNVRSLVGEGDGTLAMRETGDSIVLSVTSDVLFDFDSARLDEPARTALSRIGRMLADQKIAHVRVVGHTDAKGAEDYNQRLSEQRAEAVAQFLRDDVGASLSVEAVGRGEAEPVAPNEIDGKDNEAGRAQNRRVELVLPKS